MKAIFPFVVLGVSVFAAANPFIEKVPQRICSALGQSLSQGEAIGRLGWARACLPEFEAYYRYAERASREAKTKGHLYPIFGQEGAEMGLETVFGAGTEPPRGEGRCEVPDTVTLWALCEAVPEL